ncbi:MAG: alpha-galactosidase [Eubacterium sp.]|nr:alpha-galactosidase [Eubacterium sp.]
MEKILVNYTVKGNSFTAEDLNSAHFTIEKQVDGCRTTVYLDAKEPLTIQKFQIAYPYKFNKDNRVFVNGYQSWTDSREYFIDEEMSELSKFTEFYVKTSLVQRIGIGKSGDYFICKYPRKKGLFYGWSYGYVRTNGRVDLFGSLSERCGFTIVRFDVENQQVIIEKELEGVTFSGKTLIADYALISDDYEAAFDKYFDLMGVECTQKDKKCGYTTWYNYYGSITEDIVVRDLEALSKLDEKVDIFQIDDGYQKAIGDWLITKEDKFPNGMKKIADEIHKKDMLAGLWLAPLAVTANSKVYKEHKDWLVRDEKGKLYVAGPNWGPFYALDIYNQDAADYIRHFFDVILNEWGYDMVKLDFLYAACVLPIHGKSRGEVMCDAMDLIRDCVGDKIILGCGVPLMPAFGKVDFCRIGADVDLEWTRRKHRIREDVSTPNTVNCTVFRRHLNGRAFLNDPDVFLLRDTNTKMSFDQRALLAKVNSYFGSLLFVSDNVEDYKDNQMKVFLDTIKKKDIKILNAEFTEKHIISVTCTVDGKEERFKFNSETGESC